MGEGRDLDTLGRDRIIGEGRDLDTLGRDGRGWGS